MICKDKTCCCAYILVKKKNIYRNYHEREDMISMIIKYDESLIKIKISAEARFTVHRSSSLRGWILEIYKSKKNINQKCWI